MKKNTQLNQVQTPKQAGAKPQRTTTDFFKKIQMSSLNKRDSIANSRQNQAAAANANQNLNSINSADLQKHLNLIEESFQGVINDLQKDRMALRGKEMLNRLKKLDNGNGPMTQFIAKQRDRFDVLKKYSRDEQVVLEGAVENIEGLKTKVKREMAMVKVIDITKEPTSSQEQAQEEFIDSKKLKEKVNYMIVKAKD